MDYPPHLSAVEDLAQGGWATALLGHTGKQKTSAETQSVDGAARSVLLVSSTDSTANCRKLDEATDEIRRVVKGKT